MNWRHYLGPASGTGSTNRTFEREAKKDRVSTFPPLCLSCVRRGLSADGAPSSARTGFATGKVSPPLVSLDHDLVAITGVSPVQKRTKKTTVYYVPRPLHRISCPGAEIPRRISVSARPRPRAEFAYRAPVTSLRQRRGRFSVTQKDACA